MYIYFFAYYCKQQFLLQDFWRFNTPEFAPIAFLLMKNQLAHNVDLQLKQYNGRMAVKVAFTEAYVEEYKKSPVLLAESHVQIPLTCNFYEGTIDVDIAAERNIYADESVRAFAGIAFRKQSNTQYDMVYLRETNGQLNEVVPPGERINRAIQYVSVPKWDFDVLRTQFPGKYEAGAPIAEKRWSHLRLLIKNNTISASVDGKPIFNQIQLLEKNPAGSIAYWVGDGTDAYFSNLRIRKF